MIPALASIRAGLSALAGTPLTGSAQFYLWGRALGRHNRPIVA